MNSSGGADSPGHAERNGPPERRNQWHLEAGIAPPLIQPYLPNGGLYNQHPNPLWQGQWIRHRCPNPKLKSGHSRSMPQQVFMQHRPFGNTGPHAPAGFYPLPPPAHIPRHFLFGTQRVASRRRSNRRHLSRNTSQDWDVNGRNGAVSCNRPLDKPSDSRTKFGSCVMGKKKHHWRKRSVSGYKGVPRGNSKKNGNESTNGEDNVRDLTSFLNGSDKDSDFLNSDQHVLSYSADKDECEKNSLKGINSDICDRTHFGARTKKSSPLSCFPEKEDNQTSSENKDDELLEGAVGGVCISSKEKDILDKCPVYLLLDKDLVDEGAVCDLDGIFQNQECLRDNGKNSFFISDEECSDSSLSYRDKKASFVSSDDSESENGAYGGLPLPDPPPSQSSHIGLDTRSPRNRVQPSPHGSSKEWRKNNPSQGKADAMYPAFNGNLVDSGGEDNGDFIDTDLPSCNKHILSSSDEMENISSDEGNEKENQDKLYFMRDRKLEGTDSQSNDLSVQDKVLNELDHLSLREETGFNENGFSDKSHLYSECKSNCDAKSQNKNLVFSEEARYLSDNSDSDCENCDIAHINEAASLPSQMSRASYNVHHSEALTHHYQQIVGAAASAQPHADKTTTPYHPGADCGSLPSAIQSQYSHHDSSSVCVCNVSTSNGRDSFQSYIDNPAFSASCEQWTPSCNHLGLSVIQYPASGPSSVEGSASCSHEHYLSPINDLSARCHHGNGHLANGFSEDSGANFVNDESNQHQKVFSKKSIEDREDEETSYSAASVDDKGLCSNLSDGNGNGEYGDRCLEELLTPDSSDSVDMVLLPMEEEIEPVHFMTGLCPSAGSGSGDEEDSVTSSSFHSLASLVNNVQAVNSALSCDDCHRMCRDLPKPSNRLPSKEFYELIKSVSASDSYMRFFDKDGKDVQRSSLNAPTDDEGTEQFSRQTNSKADRLKVDRVMIWNEYEAYVVQFKQIAVSACGQTAVLNVMKALKFECDKASVCKVIKTSLRKEDKDIPEYLFSRACAGTTATELKEGVDKLSGGAVGGRFFHFWPPRKVKLLHWLAYWMKRGAIPVATMNLQQGPHSIWEVPDSWHHQMVYGVSDQGLYLTNPLEIVSERSAMNQLCSDSVLLVRRQDIVSRFQEATDLSQLLDHPDPRWMSMNVLGQVVNVLRECNMPSVPGYRLQVTSHVAVPASYEAGIMLFMRKDKGAWSSLMAAPDLPLEESPAAST